MQNAGKYGLRALGLEAWSDDRALLDGERRMLEKANEVLGFEKSLPGIAQASRGCVHTKLQAWVA